MENIDIKGSEGLSSKGRRRFLRNSAKALIYVPPVIMSMTITENSYAKKKGYHSSSGHGGSGHSGS